MKSIFYYSILILICFSFFACGESKPTKEQGVVFHCPMDCENGKTYEDFGSCPVCKMDLVPIDEDLTSKQTSDKVEISETSIFNLTSVWNTEENDSIQLKDLMGERLVIVMIYTSCKAACPRLVSDMRNIEAQIPEEDKHGIRYVLVSIDPEEDTPQVLKSFAIENEMDGPEWTFLQGNTETVREFANVLSVKYKEISPVDFSHSNIISVFNEQGELIHQQEGLGVSNAATIEAILNMKD